MKNSDSIFERNGYYDESDLYAIWREFCCAALAGGYDDPAECADKCLRELRSRFGKDG